MYSAKASISPQRNNSPRRKLNLLGRLVIITIALLLLGSSIWFSFFAVQTVPDYPVDHDATTVNDRMFMAVKVSLKGADGQPAAGAIVNVASQQLITDEEGIFYLSDVMHNTYGLKVSYQGQNFTMPIHIHAEQENYKLGMSLEIQRAGAFISAVLLVLLMGGILANSRLRRRHEAELNPRKKGLGNLLRPRPVALFLAVMIIEGLVLTPLALGSQTENVGAAATGTNLPIPTGLSANPDDHNAILTWNGGPLKPDQAEPDGVAGYKVSWGIVGQPLTNTRLVTERIVQMQPLNNGTQYAVQVQTVDTTGHLSAPSQQLTVTPSTARVDAVRAKMNGFFDDFNRAAGGFDEQKWNTAYSIDNDPAINGTFINTQFHAHNVIGNTNGSGDRVQVVNRPRAIFDYTNRTGTISFDFDGEFRRDQWYLDLVPEIMDITSQVNIEAGGTAQGHPGNYIRFHQTEQSLDIIKINANGTETNLASTDWNPYPTLDWVGLKLVPNVRRHWDIHFSQNATDIVIDGVKVLSASGLNLSYSKAIPLWTEFSYNTEKSNEPQVLIHWDNFGFDAPAGYRQTVETHNYRLTNSGTDFEQAHTVTKTLKIPDPVTGAKAARLMFSLQMGSDSFYNWSSSDSVTVNGQKFSIAKPSSSTGLPAEELVTVNSPYTVSIPLPANLLKQGDNSIVFSLVSSGVHNIHTELDFDIGAVPFTQPEKVALGATVPTMPDIGPGSRIVGVGSNKNLYIDGTREQTSDLNFNVGGIVPIDVEVTNELSMNGTGLNQGVKRVELLLDDKLIAFLDTAAEAPSPLVKYTFNVNSAQFANGKHKLYVRAFNGNNTVGYADYGGAGTVADLPYYVSITVSNANPGPTATPIVTTKPGTTTTAQPTTTVPATTTAKPTTTVAPTTTVKPTTTAPATTTVAPTTTAVPVPTTTAVPAPGGNGTGLKAEYFKGMQLGTLLLTRTDGTVNFNWATGSPATSVPVDSFSARWTGQVLPKFTETYTFYTVSDDGVRIWVNGQQVINNWTNHAPREDSGTISLQKGQKYDIKVEYYENSGGAVAKLLWSSPSQPKEVIPTSQLFPAAGGQPTPTPTVAPTTTVVATTTAKPTTTVAATTTAKPTTTAPATTPAPTPQPGTGALKSTFMVGLGNQPGELDWMTQSKVPWDLRYQYLVGDATTTDNWASWNQPTGAFASFYMSDSGANNYIPVFSYYMMNYTSPGKNDGNEANRGIVNLKTPATMKAYFANFKLLMDKAKAYGKTVIVQVEPDFWGFVQQAATSDNPTSIYAAINASGYGDVATGKPDNLAGFAQTLLALRSKYAPNVLIAWHLSSWATGVDFGTSPDPNLDMTSVINRTTKFFNGLSAKADLLFVDVSDRDAGYYATFDNQNWKHWWDLSNTTFPNPERFRSYVAGVTKGIGTKAMLWQVPVGNKLYRTENNTPNHWQDNRVEYFLGPNYKANLQAWINSGLIGIMFGAGAGDQTTYTDTGDGVTNPGAINGNNVVSTVSDDDGGYLRDRAKNYYQSGPIPLP